MVAELGLTADPADLAALRLEIKTRLSEAHPDHKLAHDTDRIQRLTEVLKAAGGPGAELATRPTALSTVAAAAALTRKENVESQVVSTRNSYRDAESRSYRGPKFSLAGVTTLLGAVFAFPKTFKDHPYIGRLINNPHFIEIWICAVLCVVAGWVFVLFAEAYQKRRVDELLSASFQKEALDRIFLVEDLEVFSTEEFQEHLYPRRVWGPDWLRQFRRKVLKQRYGTHRTPFYDQTLADRATELAIERFLSKEWIVKTTKPADAKGVDDWYRLKE